MKGDKDVIKFLNAVLKNELAQALAKAGFDAALADRAQQLLLDCDALRFTGAAPAGGLHELMNQAREIADKLRRGPTSRSRVAD